MVAIERRVLKIALALSLAVGAGACSRTDDGSVVIPRHLDMRRMWQRDDPPSSGVVSEDPTFPVAPVSETGSGRQDFASGRNRPHRRAGPAGADTSSAAGLACHAPSGTDGRVRMLCD